MSFTIRDLQTYEEMLSLRQLQREIWGLTEPDVGLYPPLLVSAAKNGGMVLGAFDDETGQMIGFLFGPPLLLEIPANIHLVKAADMDLALAWRLKVREACETYFAKGYLATDFISKVERGERRNHYTLEKATPELLTDMGISGHRTF